MMLPQPRVQAVFQDRRTAGRAITLDMNDAHTANLLLAAQGDEIDHGSARKRGRHAVHVQFGTDRQLAALQALQLPLLQSRSCKEQGLVR